MFHAIENHRCEINLRKVGDVLQIAVPALGLVVALYKEDWEGAKMWLECTVATSALSHATKFVFNYTSLGERPNGKYGSFPSAHTSSAFSGATFLGMRYGWEWGIPTSLLALVTGYSRVEAQQHHWHDVIAGEILASAVSYYLVSHRCGAEVAVC